MADQTAIVPHNPESFDDDQFFMFEEIDGDVLDMFMNDDDAANDSGDIVVADSGTGFPGFCVEGTSGAGAGDWNDGNFPNDPSFDKPVSVPSWPIPPTPYACTCCQSLREIYHTDGVYVTKLDIHGRLGMISHAVLEKYAYDEDSLRNHRECYMFDFSKESIACVKQFIIQYCDDRNKEGFVMLQDPLSPFYEALCYGIDGMAQSSQENQANEPQDSRNGVRRLSKSHIATQRERTGKMKLKDLAGYFHLPISTAAKEMNICSTALKNICRKQGLARWPHRKIKGMKREILKKKKSIVSSNGEEREHTLKEIQMLEQRLASIYEAYAA